MNVKNSPYRKLFEPGNVGALRLRNRVIMGIYPTHYAVDSQVTERMIGFYGARARGGVAMIVVEGPCLDYPRDYFGGAQVRLDEDSFLPGLRRLAEKKVIILTKVQVARIDADGLAYRDENGTESFLPVDTVVLAAGTRPDPTLVQALEGKVAEVYAVGDCDQPGIGGMAIRAGLDLGMRI
ncbi:MAG: hypothetical protein HY675_27750 [Chloroflexi bacterium]|nr:hypothetical protein [Chloroflexota bacterium]